MRATWIRGLRICRQIDQTNADESVFDDMLLDDTHVHARSRFRSVTHPERIALYSVHDPAHIGDMTGPGDHTLVSVREFRRVPLQASTLGLVLFAARAGTEAQVLAMLAHYAERALSAYQPSYLLLARSLEAPGIVALITGVQAPAALESSAVTAFSLDPLLPELMPLLAAEPELYAYDPEPQAEPLVPAVSPYAV